MCHPKQCKTCGRTTWTGCGQHVAEVKAQVPAAQWCPGHPRSDRSARSWFGPKR